MDGDTPVYAGKSKQLLVRLGQHKKKKFNRVLYDPQADSRELKHTERAVIKALRPPMNREKFRFDALTGPERSALERLYHRPPSALMGVVIPSNPLGTTTRELHSMEAVRKILIEAEQAAEKAKADFVRDFVKKKLMEDEDVRRLVSLVNDGPEFTLPVRAKAAFTPSLLDAVGGDDDAGHPRHWGEAESRCAMLRTFLENKKGSVGLRTRELSRLDSANEFIKGVARGNPAVDRYVSRCAKALKGEDTQDYAKELQDYAKEVQDDHNAFWAKTKDAIAAVKRGDRAPRAPRIFWQNYPQLRKELAIGLINVREGGVTGPEDVGRFLPRAVELAAAQVEGFVPNDEDYAVKVRQQLYEISKALDGDGKEAFNEVVKAARETMAKATN